MFEFFASYIQNIAIFLVFIAIVEMILPENGYSKYIRTFIGFILMINIILPFYNFEYEKTEVEDEFYFDDYELDTRSNFKFFLDKAVKENVKEIIKEKGNLEVDNIDVVFLVVSEEDFVIDELNIYVKSNDEVSIEDKNELKKLIFNEYFNHINNINIEYKIQRSMAENI